MLSPGSVAGVTVGGLAILVTAFCVFGTIFNYFQIRSKAKRNAKIESQHQRWASNENDPRTSSPRPNHYISDIETNLTSFHAAEKSITLDEEEASEIGIAWSPETKISQSPESYQSQSSDSALLKANFSKPLPALPVLATARPESRDTVFEEFNEPQHLEAPPDLSSQPFMTKASTLRHQQSPPARLRISSNPPRLPPIKIFPPNDNVVAMLAKYQRRGLNPMSIDCSRSSSPLAHAILPPPPIAAILRPSPAQLLPSAVEDDRPIGRRKETPSYLPDYYTSPTPQAPITWYGMREDRIRAGLEVPSNTTGPASAVSSNPPDLDPSSASSAGSDTTFESGDDGNQTLPKAQSMYTRPMLTGPDSSLRDLRYPKIPRPSNRMIPRTPAPVARPKYPDRTSSRRDPRRMQEDHSSSSRQTEINGTLNSAQTRLQRHLPGSRFSIRDHQKDSGGSDWPNRESSIDRRSKMRDDFEMAGIAQPPGRPLRAVGTGDVIIRIDSP